MAARGSTAATAELAELADRIGQLEEIITTWIQIEARDKVRQAPGNHPATFRAILVSELRIATDQEVQAVENWLTAHQGG